MASYLCVDCGQLVIVEAEVSEAQEHALNNHGQCSACREEGEGPENEHIPYGWCGECHCDLYEDGKDTHLVGCPHEVVKGPHEECSHSEGAVIVGFGDGDHVAVCVTCGEVC